jgi:type I restriction enzyme S subunit
MGNKSVGARESRGTGVWELPQGWEWTPLSSVADVGNGYGFPKRFQGETDLSYPFIKVSDMNLPENEVYVTKAANTVDDELLGTLGARLYPPGTVIFPKIGGAIATNKKRILAKEATFDNNVMGVTPREPLSIEWLYFYLRSVDLMILARTTALPSIRQSDIKGMLIPLAPPEEQRRIVARIEELFARIAEARRLRSVAGEDSDKLLDATTAEVFSAQATSSWEEATLGKLAEIDAELVDPTLPEYKDLPHINGTVIESGTCRLLPYNTAAEDGMTSGKYLFTPGDVLYSKIRPYLRKATKVDFAGLCSADMYPLTVTDERLLPRFLMWSLVSPPFTAYAAEHSGRARMPKLNRKQVFSYSFPLPQTDEQQRVVEHLDKVQAQTEDLKRAQRAAEAELDRLEQSVLAQAFRGEL